MTRGDFWTRRRAAVEAETLEQERREAEMEAETLEAQQAARPDTEVLEELGLPDPDTLGPGDDFKVFLAKAVPARIRSRALRRLWGTNPVLANIDGLVDYGEDFTDASCVIDNLQTAYQVGKGMTAHVEELARQAEEALAAEEAPCEDEPETETEPEPEAEHTVLAAAEPGVEPSDVETGPQPLAASATEDSAADVPPPLRRMRFRFETGGIGT